MTNVTIVTDSSGELIGAVMGHSLRSKHGDIEAHVSFADGHRLHKVEVEDEIAEIDDAALFHERLLRHVPKS